MVTKKETSLCPKCGQYHGDDSCAIAELLHGMEEARKREGEKYQALKEAATADPHKSLGKC